MTHGRVPGLPLVHVHGRTLVPADGGRAWARAPGTAGSPRSPVDHQGPSRSRDRCSRRQLLLRDRHRHGPARRRLRGGARTGATPSLNHPIIGTTVVTSNVWHHAAATYDGTTWRLYLDGDAGRIPRCRTAGQRRRDVADHASGRRCTRPALHRRLLRGPDRRGTHLEHRSFPEPDPGRDEHGDRPHERPARPLAPERGTRHLYRRHRWGRRHPTPGRLLPRRRGSTGDNPFSTTQRPLAQRDNQYVTMGASPGLRCSTFTVELWFRRTAAGVGTSTGTGGVTTRSR